MNEFYGDENPIELKKKPFMSPKAYRKRRVKKRDLLCREDGHKECRSRTYDESEVHFPE